MRPEDLFVKVHMKLTGAMLLRDPELMPRDVAVLLALIGEMDPYTGRIFLSASALGRLCGIRQTTIATSLSRLKKRLLVVNRLCKRTGAYYMLVNPDFASIGDSRRRALTAAQFQEEWLSAVADEVGGDRDLAMKRWHELSQRQQETLRDQDRVQDQALQMAAEAQARLHYKTRRLVGKLECSGGKV